MNNKKTLWSLLVSTCVLATGCSSGGSSNNSSGTNTQTVYVPETSQVRTPVSAKTVFTKNTTTNGLQKASLGCHMPKR